MILSGVSINLVVVGDEIISKASKAVLENEKAQAKEDLEMLVTEEMLSYYIEDTSSNNFLDYFYNKYKDGSILKSGATIFAEVEEKCVIVTYTNPKGKNIGEYSIDKDGIVTLESVVDESGVIVDSKSPIVHPLASTTSSITFRATDRQGVVAWAVMEGEAEPTESEWKTVTMQKIFEETKSGLKSNILHTIWVKDKAGNVGKTTQVTKDFIPIEYTAAQNGSNFIVTVTSPENIDNIFYQIGNSGTKTAYTKPIIVPSGSRFAIWSEDDAGNSSSEKSETFLAKITITYNANGGSGIVPNDVETEHTKTVAVDTQAQLTKTGYTFIGWALTNNATAGISIVEADDENMTLYAVWSINSISNITNNLAKATGLEDDPYYICSIEDLIIFSNNVNNRKSLH